MKSYIIFTAFVVSLLSMTASAYAACPAGHIDNGDGTCTYSNSTPVIDHTVSRSFSGWLGDLSQGTEMRIGKEDTSSTTGACSGDPRCLDRSTIEWDITTIPDQAIILDVSFNYSMDGNAGAPSDGDIWSMENQPSGGSLVNLTIFNDIADVTLYVNNWDPTASQNNSQTDLGTDADSAVQSSLSLDWFAIGLESDDGTYSFVNDYRRMREQTDPAATPSPTLLVTYRLPVCVVETNNCFLTIQEAVNNATSYQTVDIYGEGMEYNENVEFNVTGINVTTRSTSAPMVWQTSIDTFNVTRDDVTIQGLHLKYNGSSNSIRTILVLDVNNITILNNTIENPGSGNNGHGIGLNPSNFSTVQDNIIEVSGSSTNHGVWMAQRSFNNTVIGNYINSTGTSSGAGIWIRSNSNGTQIHQNTIRTNMSSGGDTYGVYMEFYNHLTNITENDIDLWATGDYNYGIWIIDSYEVLVDNNTISSYGGGRNRPIQMDNSGGNVITDNILIADGDKSASRCCNIGINQVGWHANPNLVYSNYISTNGDNVNYGINIGDGSMNISHNTIITNGATGQNYGVFALGGANSNITYNTISTNGNGDWNYGINIQDPNVNASHNIITTNGTDESAGISIQDNVATVINNSISTSTADSNYGIWVFDDNARVESNRINTSGTNNNYGIYVDFGSDFSIIRNNIVNATGTGTGNDGINFFGADSSITSNNQIDSTSNGIIFTSSSFNNNITSSTINGQLNDIRDELSSAGTNYFIDSTFDENNISFSATSVGKIFVLNTLNVRITNEFGSPINLADVTINDTNSVDNIENPNSNFYFITNSSGYIPSILATEFAGNRTHNSTSGYISFNDYTIAASGSGLFSNSSDYTITSATTLTIILGQFLTGTIFGKGTDSFELGDDNADGIYAYVNGVNATGTMSQGWNHVVMTFESGSIKLYVNGVEVDSGGTGSTPNINSKDILLGNGTSATIDEVRLYSEAMTPAEINQRYNIGSALKIAIEALNTGSFGKQFTAAIVTDGGTFNEDIILTNDLLAGTVDTIVVNNVTGVPQTVSVRSSSCSVTAEAGSSMMEGLRC